MAIALGSAYVDIVPSTSNLAGKLRDQLEVPLQRSADRAGRDYGDRFTRNIASSVSGAISSAVRSATRAAYSAMETTAAAGSTLFATSLFAGFNRLTAIDDARGKLRGLGHDALAIDTIMTSALDSVRGTAFGLGEAATNAATAVAAGIEPGKELTNYLKLVADTSTIAGGSLSEIGSILNKTTTAGRVYTLELQQLADRGLPVFTWLADAYGVSSDELRKMVSDGKIEATRFRQILEDNIGGAALASGDTFRGGLANVRAAMGRFGETVLEPFFEASKDVFPAFITAWDNMAAAIEPTITGIAESDGFTRFTGWLKDSPAVVGNLTAKLKDLGPALAPLGAFVGALSLGGLSSLPLMGFLPTINPVVAAFGAWVLTNDELRESVQNLGSALWDAGQRIAEAAAPLIERVGPYLEGAFKTLVDWLANTAVPTISNVVVGVIDVFSRLGDLFQSEGLGGIASRLWDWIAEQAPILGEKFLEWGAALVGWIAPRAADFLLELGDWLKQGTEWILRDGVPMLAEAAGNFASSLIDWVWNDAIPGVLEAIPGLLVEFEHWVRTKGIPGFLEFGKDLGEALMDGLVEAFKDIPTPLEFFIDLTKDRSGLPVPPELRARGGPVRAGMPYIVGEHRPELFVPHTSGYILPRVPDVISDAQFSTRDAGSGPLIGVLNVTQLPGEDQAGAISRTLRHHQRIRDQVVAR